MSPHYRLIAEKEEELRKLKQAVAASAVKKRKKGVIPSMITHEMVSRIT